MGLEFVEGKNSVTQYNKTEKAEIKLDDAVGLSLQEDGTYSMVGDFYHSNNHKLSKYYNNTGQWTADLATAYAIEEVTTRLGEQNFFCSENTEAEVDGEGMISMSFESYS